MAEPKNDQNIAMYFVTHEGQKRGPFDLEMIEAMALAGHFPADVPICRCGTDEWVPLDSRCLPPALPSREFAIPSKKNKGAPAANILFIAVGSLVVLIIGANILNKEKPSHSGSNSFSKTEYPPPASSYTSPKATYTPSTSSYTPPKTNLPSSYTPAKSTNILPKESSDSKLYRSANGQTYRVPNSAYQRLIIKRSELDAKQRLINSNKEVVDSLSAELNRLKTTINRTSQYQVDSFNKKVKAFNDKNDQLQIQIDSFNSAVDAFNVELARCGTPVR
jgi:hypothetical protein